MRNGPNPRLSPIGSYLYPLDGAGMIHGGDGFLGVRDTAGLENPQVAADDDFVRLRLGAVLHRETAVHGSPTGPGSVYLWIPAD